MEIVRILVYDCRQTARRDRVVVVFSRPATNVLQKTKSWVGFCQQHAYLPRGNHQSEIAYYLFVQIVGQAGGTPSVIILFTFVQGFTSRKLGAPCRSISF